MFATSFTNIISWNLTLKRQQPNCDFSFISLTPNVRPAFRSRIYSSQNAFWPLALEDEIRLKVFKVVVNNLIKQGGLFPQTFFQLQIALLCTSINIGEPGIPLGNSQIVIGSWSWSISRVSFSVLVHIVHCLAFHWEAPGKVDRSCGYSWLIHLISDTHHWLKTRRMLNNQAC